MSHSTTAARHETGWGGECGESCCEDEHRGPDLRTTGQQCGAGAPARAPGPAATSVRPTRIDLTRGRAVVAGQVVADALPAGDLAQECHHVTLEPVPCAVAVARRFVCSHAPDLPVDTEASLELLTSELVTNAVVHARTTLDVEVLVSTRSLVVRVHDLALVTAVPTPDADREGGWGLGLVAALAQEWAVDHRPGGGRTVWFRLPRAEAVQTADGAAARTDADRRDS